MNSPRPGLFAGALLSLAVLAGCAGGGPSWSFAPLGPTPPPTASPGPSPDAALRLAVVTPADDPLIFDPNELEAPPATDVTVVYLNDSNLVHNIHFFAGPDRNAESLAATDLVTGPDAEEQVTFTTPEEPGDYFFVCDVHPEMTGTLIISEDAPAGGAGEGEGEGEQASPTAQP